MVRIFAERTLQDTEVKVSGERTLARLCYAEIIEMVTIQGGLQQLCICLLASSTELVTVRSSYGTPPPYNLLSCIVLSDLGYAGIGC
jgi:hypothetical protein